MLIPAVGIAISTMFSSGCATSDGAPFHMYDSPLLEGRVESRYPKSRAYDPLELGDHPAPQTQYASNDEPADAARGGGPSAKPAPSKPDKPTTPALSTRRAPKKTHTGGPSASADSARASSEDDAAPADDSEAALAADYIWSVYAFNGVEFSASARRSVPKLFRECKERGNVYHSSRPAIGDIVFFHNTDDYNGDGRNNDWYTHAALVESHDSGGKITLLGYRGGDIERITINLESPDAAKTRHGETANTQLRPKRSDDAPFTQYLAGQLFAGTCSALGDKAEMVVIDNWEPGMTLRD